MITEGENKLLHNNKYFGNISIVPKKEITLQDNEVVYVVQVTTYIPNRKRNRNSIVILRNSSYEDAELRRLFHHALLQLSKRSITISGNTFTICFMIQDTESDVSMRLKMKWELCEKVTERILLNMMFISGQNPHLILKILFLTIKPLKHMIQVY